MLRNFFTTNSFNWLLLSGVLVFAGACGKHETPNTTVKQSPISVTISSPTGQVAGGISVSGLLESKQTANISTRMMGHIRKVHVKVGDRVGAGQLLVTINSDDIQAKRMQTNAAIAEAEANVNSAQKDYDRFNTLFQKKSATAKEMDNITLQYNSAKARLDAAKQMRNEVNAMNSYSSLTAPFAGVVTQRMADDGDMANPGMPILTIEQAGVLQVSASVSESEIGDLKLGAKAQIAVKATDKTIQATVAEISPSSQYTGGQYMVKFSIPEKERTGLYSGMYVHVFVPLENKTTQHDSAQNILVPSSAVFQKDELMGLYTISSSNTALLRWVRVGKSFGNMVEILSGLSANESFITSADGQLFNGAPVQVKK